MEKWASKWLKCVLRYTDFTNFSGGGPPPPNERGFTPLSDSPLAARLSPLGSRLRLSVPPGNNISGSGPERLATEIRDIGFLSTYYEYFV